ncbi:MAG TPA: hypothetical protein VLB00_09250 [Gemmatimonadales bacterium]|nr:hypothetical protein [Gemmatimonadales bacterium]
MIPPGGWFREIREDSSLRLYGCALALTHAVTMLFWRQQSVISFLGRGTEAICWPLLRGCETFRALTVQQLAWGLRGYFVAAVLVAALFLIPRRTTLACLGLAALSLFMLLFAGLDFRLRANQHYMVLWISAVFLLLPSKRDAIRVLLVLFYVWAASLKLNAEWISGAALPVADWIIPTSLVGAACIYLIVLEGGMSWGLLAGPGWIFWGALAQFYLFHTLSWQQVGFYFPMVMFLLLSVFPMIRLGPGGREAPSVLSRLVRGRLRPSTYAVLAGFSLLQLPPRLIPGDAALTGEGRSYALHMVDAGVRCRGWAVVRRQDGSTLEVDLQGKAVARIACDPIVIAERARNICEGRSRFASRAAELDLHLVARRPSWPALQTIIDLPGFCARKVRYNPFGRNDWIRAAESYSPRSRRSDP